MISTITTLETLEDCAREVLDMLPSSESAATMVALVGDLGAGKTTFVQALARQLGVIDVVTSPTYLIMRGYTADHPQFEQLIHMDAYRLEDESELGPLRFAQVLSTPKTLVCIEWADRIKAALPKATILLTFTLHPDGTRTIAQATW